MKALYLIILCYVFFGITLEPFAQNTFKGTFAHGDSIGDALISINTDGTFWYIPGLTIKNSADDCKGTWKIKDDTLILNSYQQRILVLEDYNRKSKDITLVVLPANYPNKKSLICNIFLLTEKGDTLCFHKTNRIKIKKHFKSLWIEDIETGLKSQPYMVSTNANCFNVLFYNGRVFENENWVIVDENNITPINLAKSVIWSRKNEEY